MHDAPHSNRQSGFSLLELIIVVAILTIVTGAAFQLMSGTQASFDRNQLLAEAHQNADFAVLRVTELLRGSGTNPYGLSTINNYKFLLYKEVGSTTNDNRVLRLLSDLNCDNATDARVTASGSNYYILSSEDVTLKYYPDDTTVGSVTIPARSLCMIDNTPDPVGSTSPNQGVPIVLASNIAGFSSTLSADGKEITVSITAGPSRPIPVTDPRYVSFTRTAQIKLRNR
jgi:prepilin-type N-terminal cleavage/methylation domain-containing protein